MLMPIHSRSLSTRLLVTMTILLLAAFALTIFLLDTIFQRASENAIHDLLEVQVFALIGLAEPDSADHLSLPTQLPDARLSSLGSGLYAEIVDKQGGRVWRSPSAIGMGLADGLSVGAGQRVYQRRLLADGTEALVLGIGITWELVGDVTYGFQIYVGENLAGYNRQLARFRQQLMGWFGVVMFALLFGMALLLRWGLAPLRRMANEIAAIEDGRVAALSEDYPRELSGVASNMNQLINSERQRIMRFRTTMDDLAHSLKTPLAVLHTELERSDPDHKTLRDQISRMEGVVDYRLRRAAATGPRTLARRPIAIAPICREIASSLRKIYREKDVQFDMQIPDGASYAAEPGDLYELIGNLLDNAWKWSAGHVVVTVNGDPPGANSGHSQFVLTISDDGPGVSDDQAATILNRGERGDQRGDVPGQGIGLAVVAEIVELYGGAITVKRSATGGAEFELRLPA
jgi:two-component system sensor histidine kinase PhoQ